jgi:hypothetical protein
MWSANNESIELRRRARCSTDVLRAWQVMLAAWPRNLAASKAVIPPRFRRHDPAWSLTITSYPTYRHSQPTNLQTKAYSRPQRRQGTGTVFSRLQCLEVDSLILANDPYHRKAGTRDLE